MGSRELWERHAVLAGAFCRSDDEVRVARGVLDAAQLGRSRMLAAFAVTVGSDGAVAELLGLQEREVRGARRSVGKEEAQGVARGLLSAQNSRRTGTEGAGTAGAPGASGSRAGGDGAAGVSASTTGAGAASGPGPVGGGWSVWDPAWDGALVRGWCSGSDVGMLAAELGVGLAQVVARAQELFAEGRLTMGGGQERDRAGRHRRVRGGGGGAAESARGAAGGGAHLSSGGAPSPEGPYAQSPSGYPTYTASQSASGAFAFPFSAPPSAAPAAGNDGGYEYAYPQAAWASPGAAGMTDGAGNVSWSEVTYASAGGVETGSGVWEQTPTGTGDAVTASVHDWDGILSRWEAANAGSTPTR